ncbi:MFS transporter [Pigmentiphaga aceris]|uniref:MFS transporter n=1 Tax=Pigmentiphaga aceris TaxID=1940612 RepID=A0A5C0AXL2_9BURK|nr:MFS transporter [Pigmentiphaga aceris]QEI06163.1 MFS transporter [Pigmentiphaga aceris]
MQTAQHEVSALEKETMRRVTLRLIPFLMLCYFFALLDRVNVGFASLQMNQDLGLSASVFGLGSSLFFVAYFLVEVPSNLALEKFGARRWIARIMITWGLISAGMALVVGPYSFYAMRLLLGAAEAGFFPGVLLYLTYWLPGAYRGRIIAILMVSVPVASFIGSPLSAMLLQLDGLYGLHGWQWLFIVEGLPAVLLGMACLRVMTDRPASAQWLSAEQREWLSQRIATEGAKKVAIGHLTIWQLLRNKQFLAMAMICAGASATGSALAVWQPQLLKSFGLSTMQTGFVNSVPYGIAAVLMVFWGRHSDRTGERRWHTALTLWLIAGALAILAIAQGNLVMTVGLLSCCLIGAYSFKGPFWALSSTWMSPKTVAAGLAGINAIANLMGGGAISLIGWVKQTTGSFTLGLLPLMLLTLMGGAAVLLLARQTAAPTAPINASTTPSV